MLHVSESASSGDSLTRGELIFTLVGAGQDTYFLLICCYILGYEVGHQSEDGRLECSRDQEGSIRLHCEIQNARKRWDLSFES